MAILLAVAFACGPQHASAIGSGKHKVDQRWFLGTALNYNLPTGKLDYSTTFDPVFTPTSTMVKGGFSVKPSFSYSVHAGYDRSITTNGIHGFAIALGLTDYKTLMQYHDYSFYYHGFQYTQHIDRYVFDDLNFELRLAYRFRKDRTSIQLGALGLIRSNRIFREFDLDGIHGRSGIAYWWDLRKWLPTAQVNYRILAKDRTRFEVFMAGDKRTWEEDETHWWDIQVGVRVSLVKAAKRRP